MSSTRTLHRYFVGAIGIVVTLCCFSSPILAFDQCDGLLATPQALEEMILQHGVYNAPVKYFDRARAIKLDLTADARGLIPKADYDAAGRPTIYYPLAFLPTLCRIALATFLDLEGHSKGLADASRDAGKCIDAGRPFDVCLREYGLDLEKRYREAFMALKESAQQIAYAIYRDTAAQIATHEYAHHLLEHHQRIRSGDVKRIDAEFEADFYAIQNAIQSDGVPSAMAYFFIALDEVQKHSYTARSPDYESGACRTENVNSIAHTFELTPMIILNAVKGRQGRLGGSENQDTLRSEVERLQTSAPAAQSADNCGRLKTVFLREAQDELLHLTTLFAEYENALNVANKVAGSGDAIRGTKIHELIDRLATKLIEFKHIKGLAAKSVSILIYRADLAKVDDTLALILDRILETTKNDMLCTDYGAILGAKGTRVLYRSPKKPLESRMVEATGLFGKAVTYAPGLAEGWANLAMIAFAKGQCNEAARFAEKSVNTSTDDQQRKGMKDFRDGMKKFSNFGVCANMAKDWRKTFAQ